MTINFKQNIQNFKLDSIQQNISGSLPAGHLIQIDSRECDNLVASGKTKDKSCQFKFAYTGDSMNQSPDIINFNFIADETPLTFALTVNNTLQTIQNIPIISDMGRRDNIQTAILASENSSGDGIDYDNQIKNQFILQNIGNGSILNTNNPTIIVKGGNSFGSNYSNLYYGENFYTTCGKNSVNPAASCDVPLLYSPQIKDGKIVSQYGRLIYTYQTQNQPINYTNRVIFSSGSIIPKDIFVDIYESTEFTLTKQNVANKLLAYNIKLSNFKLTIKPNYLFDLPSISLGSEVQYGYGELNEDLLKNINLKYDSNCFEKAFDLDEENDYSSRSCKIIVENTNPKTLLTPIGGRLIASYDSPIQHRSVEQDLGSIIIYNHISSQLPPEDIGAYKHNCSNLTYASGIINGNCSLNGISKNVTLNYKQTCIDNSKVDLISTLSGEVALLCDQFNYANLKNVTIPKNWRIIDGHSNGDLIWVTEFNAVPISFNNPTQQSQINQIYHFRQSGGGHNYSCEEISSQGLVNGLVCK